MGGGAGIHGMRGQGPTQPVVGQDPERSPSSTMHPKCPLCREWQRLRPSLGHRDAQGSSLRAENSGAGLLPPAQHRTLPAPAWGFAQPSLQGRRPFALSGGLGRIHIPPGKVHSPSPSPARASPGPQLQQEGKGLDPAPQGGPLLLTARSHQETLSLPCGPLHPIPEEHRQLLLQ